jgi:glycerophosphoryl diester phosphodiesterase
LSVAEIQGHRGARALFPENTLHGFAAARDLGIATVEIDIAVTADNVPVICHDMVLNPDITRTPDGAWLDRSDIAVNHLTLAELRRYDVGRIRPGTAYAARFPRQQPVDGAAIPTLREALAALPTMRFNIELKLSPYARALTVAPGVMTELVLAEIDDAGAVSRVSVQSFDWRPMRRLRRLRPDVALSFLTEPATVAAARAWWDLPAEQPVPSLPGAIADAAAAPPQPASWACEHAALSPALVAEAHALGLRVLAWTVNEAADMARLLAWGVDGLITDDPALAQEALRQAATGSAA